MPIYTSSPPSSPSPSPSPSSLLSLWWKFRNCNRVVNSQANNLSNNFWRKSPTGKITIQYEIHRHCALKTDFNFVWNHSNLDSTGLVAVLLYSPLYKYQPVCVKQSTIKTTVPPFDFERKYIFWQKQKQKSFHIFWSSQIYEPQTLTDLNCFHSDFGVCSLG